VKNSPFTDVKLETARVLLRPFEERDWPAFAEIASKDAVLEFLPANDRMTRDQLQNVFAWLRECYNRNTVDRIEKFTLPVILKQTGEVVGWCGLGPLEYDESQIEVYFVIDPEQWGKGLATEAAAALLEYAFEVLRLGRVVAVADPRNGASIRVLRKLGMKEEGVVQDLPAEHRDYEGHLWYSMTAETWSVTAKTLH
jgi:ribosomal-protein-alanine N-acetyltransferase